MDEAHSIDCRVNGQILNQGVNCYRHTLQDRTKHRVSKLFQEILHNLAVKAKKENARPASPTDDRVLEWACQVLWVLTTQWTHRKELKLFPSSLRYVVAEAHTMTLKNVRSVDLPNGPFKDKATQVVNVMLRHS